jgi:hypothetical protein
VSGQSRGSRPAWLAPALIPMAALVTLLTLRHSRTIYTSDSTAQQSLVRTWLDVGHGLAYVPQDTWALKVPLYLVLENLPLSPMHRLLAAVLALNALTFLILGWATWRLARNWRSGVRWYEVTVPLAWLATLGGGVGSNRMLPNYRNIELGLYVALLALLAIYLSDRRPAGQTVSRGRWLRLATGGALAMAMLWFDDPYFWLLAGAPLLVAALGWWVVRERDPRLLHIAAVTAASFVLSAGLRAIGELFGLRYAGPDHTLAVSPSDLIDRLALLLPSTKLLLGVDRWGGGATTTLTQTLVILVVTAMLVATTALAWQGWREGRFVLVFLGLHWPLVVGGFLVSWYTQDLSAGRYLVLAICDLAVATAVLLPDLRARRPGVAGGLTVLIAIGAVLNLGTGASWAIDAAGRPSAELPHQRAVVRAVQQAAEDHGAVKGYAPFWSANITSYLAGTGTTATEIICRDGRLGTRNWLTDSARLHRPAQRVFLIWDPKEPGMVGCPASVRDTQLGPPIATYPVAPAPVPSPGGGIIAVLVYAPDIEARLRPVGDA